MIAPETKIKSAVKVAIFAALGILLSFSSNKTYGQAQCDSLVPTYTADLSNDPNGTWISPDTTRHSNCCGTTKPDKCIEFILTLHPDADGIIFDIASGAMPPGALYYQVDCGPQTSVGEPLCLDGPGPHHVTFCKPGNNNNTYMIRSISEPIIGSDITVNDGCSGMLYAQFYDESTVTWNSVYPGNPGDYNSYLSCSSGCDSTTFTAQAGLPPYIDFEVCGLPFGGCDTVPYCDTVRVYYNPTLEVNITPENPTICYGNNTTTITANGSGGSPPYVYSWSTGDTSQSITVGVGTYTVEMQDTSGCPPAYDTVTVTEFLNPITAFAGNDTVICMDFLPIQLNGSVTGVSTGTWSGGNGTFSPHADSLDATYSPTQAEISQGYIKLILTTTNNGTCPPDQDTIRINFSEFTATPTINITDCSCFGADDGQAYVDMSSGSNPPYSVTYLTNPPSTQNPLTGLAPGSYQVEITNGYGCDTIISFMISEPPPLTPQIDSLENVSCNGGSDGYASIAVTGGTPPYTFNWNTNPVNYTNTNSNLSAGTYNVTIVDGNGCDTSITVTITEPDPLVSNIPSSTNASCYGSSDGQATVSVSGGTTPYSYSWNTNPQQNTATANNLSQGTYVVTINDDNNCTIYDTVTITEPTPLTSSTQSINVSCFGAQDGSGAVNVSGGTAPYSYSWNTNPAQTGASFNNVGPGTYIVSITDDNNCTHKDTITITEPAKLSASLTSFNDVSCNGLSDGEASVSVTGGTTPYSYNWNTNPVQNTTTASNLPKGTYLFTVTDNNGCQDTLSVTIDEPAPLSLTLDVEDVSCFGGNDGSMKANVNGGTTPYAYSWTPSSSNSSQISMLNANSYSVKVADANGCEISDSAAVSEPGPVVVTSSGNQTICPNDSATISANASGGNGGYTYSWNQGLGNGQTQKVSPIYDNTYIVTAYDSLGCPSQPDTLNIFIRNLWPDSLQIFSGGDVCEGNISSISGKHHNNSNYNYTYNWSNGLTGLGPHNITVNNTNTYVLTVTDEVCNISISDSVTIEAHPYPEVELPESFGEGCPPLTVNLFNTSGSNNPPGTTYSWSFGDGNNSDQPNPTHYYSDPGTYNISLSATSAEGCMTNSTTKSTVEIYPTPMAMFDFSPKEIEILNPEVEFMNESMNANKYDWSFGDGGKSTLKDPKHTYQDTGNYKVRLKATNNAGCVDTHIVELRVKHYFIVYIPNAFTPNGNGKNETFYPKGVGISDDNYSLKIFDRWGNMIFESTHIDNHWDGSVHNNGKIVQTGVYVYKLTVEDVVHHKQHDYFGKVTLLK